MAQPRALVIAETGSAATVIEDFWGAEGNSHFTNTVSEFFVDTNAQITPPAGAAGRIRHLPHRQNCRHPGTGQPLRQHGCFLRRKAFSPQLGGVPDGRADRDQAVWGWPAIADSQHNDTHSLVALNHPHGTVEATAQVHRGWQSPLRLQWSCGGGTKGSAYQAPASSTATCCCQTKLG